MKTLRSRILTLFCLLACGLSFAEDRPLENGAKPARTPTPTPFYRPKTYETGAQLLIGINAWLNRYGLPALDYDEMCVRLAEHASSAGKSQDLGPLAVNFLKCLVKRRRFVNSVELYEWDEIDIPLSSDLSTGERLPLPRHSILNLHVLTIPRNYRNRDKIVNWYTLFVAYAMDKGQKHDTIRP